MNSINKFINQSNNSLANNTIFRNLKYDRKLVFVEGFQDKIFYENFLSNSFKKQIVKYCVCNGKQNVLNKSIVDNGQDYLYIIDSDYDVFHESVEYEDNVILTTGYSLENFYFYNDSSDINYDNITRFFNAFVKEYCDDAMWKLIADKLIKEFKIILEDYKEKTLDYYAYHLARSSYGDTKFFLSNGDEIKQYIEEYIPKEISELNAMQYDIITKKYEDSKKIIKDNGYLWIRGHDIFDILVTFLKNNQKYFNIEITFDNILSCADHLYVPKEFI